MGVLSGLQPEPVFIYFEEICGIPHTSYHEKQLSDYMIAFAARRMKWVMSLSYPKPLQVMKMQNQ